jgi:hypothetical protein
LLSRSRFLLKDRLYPDSVAVQDDAAGGQPLGAVQ